MRASSQQSGKLAHERSKSQTDTCSRFFSACMGDTLASEVHADLCILPFKSDASVLLSSVC